MPIAAPERLGWKEQVAACAATASWPLNAPSRKH